jgi:S1-C subfamily serine protease
MVASMLATGTAVPTPTTKMALCLIARRRLPLRQTPVKTIKQTGAGFVISANGHVATNQHVIEGCAGDIQGNLSGESPIKLRVDHSHRDRSEHDREKIRQLTQHCPPS